MNPSLQLLAEAVVGTGRHLGKRAANKGNILKLSWLHLLLLPSHGSSEERVEATRAAERQRAWGRRVTCPSVVLQAGGICTVLAFPKPWGQSAVAI